MMSDDMSTRHTQTETDQMSQQIFSPVDLQGLILKNRVVMAPLTRGRAGRDRVPGDLIVEHYRQRAGAGLIITEGTTISSAANGWVDSPGIYTDAQEEGWKRVVSAVHEEGGRIFLQLWHTGRASHSSFRDGETPVAPSAIKIDGDGLSTAEGTQPHETPRALKRSEIDGIIAHYVQAAERAKRAGFDGVEVQSANGYLLDGFLQSKTNQRTDEYGGSVENRFRLLREVLNAITQVFPSERVAVRLSPNGVFNDMGSPDNRATFLYAARELGTFGLAYLHIVDGLAFGFHGLGEPITLSDVREVYGGTLMGNSGYDLELANKTLENGRAELVAFGRAFIANPDLVERLRNGWPLAESDMDFWYAGGAKGYTDYPSYADTEAPAAEEIEHVRKNLETWLAAFNARDIDTLFSLYDPESVYANAGAPMMRGVEAIKPWYEEAFKNIEGTLLHKEEVAFIEGSMALLVGAYYFAPPDGVTPPSDALLTGRVALVYRRNDAGEWKLLFDMDNTPPDITPESF
ncbi:MAG: nuclear transport factor 2 family protein [Acidobacteriota bacterium]